MTSIVERIWGYDASLWTDSGEDQWLGWLDVVPRVRVHVDELNGFSTISRTHPSFARRSPISVTAAVKACGGTAR